MIKIPLENAWRKSVANKCPSSLSVFRGNAFSLLQSRFKHSRVKIINVKNEFGGTFYNTKRDRWELEDDMTNFEHLKRGAKLLPGEIRKMTKEIRDHFHPDQKPEAFPLFGVDKFFTFGSPESLENWSVSCDQDNLVGFSTAEVSLSPSGTGLFTGNISTRVPKDGKIENAGYANIRYIPPLKSFGRENPYFFATYTDLVLRVRGDGRNYMVNLHPRGVFDYHWFDLYSYVLHTRGGPYWQETKIPFSKFFLSHKGRVQDKQCAMDLTEVKTVSITLMDQNDGPFHLEIDYIGCERDELHTTEEFAYEQYHNWKWLPSH